jgi:hypothetical protein
VKSVDRKTNTIIVEGKKLVNEVYFVDKPFILLILIVILTGKEACSKATCFT